MNDVAFQLRLTEVPEPSTLGLLVSGVIIAGMHTRRRRQQLP